MNLRDLDGFYACQMCFDPLKFDKTLLDVDMALLHDNFMGISIFFKKCLFFVFCCFFNSPTKQNQIISIFMIVIFFKI